jgi:homoserine dehydrogenase
MAKSSEIPRVKIGMLGSGTVGNAIQEFVFNGNLADKLGVMVEMVKIYTRHPKQKKWYSTHPSLFTTKAHEVTDHPDIDIVIEVLGSQQKKDLSVFKDYVIRAMQNGKAVVKEIGFEASVGGSIPIIKSLRESLAAEEPEAIYGIVNGTSNYILTEMKNGGKSYEESLVEAQERGYAETNPEMDVTGMDAEAKLILLSTVAFGLQLEPGVIYRRGIDEIHAIDFQYACSKGSSTIKSLAVARNEEGAVQAFVSPVLVPNEHFLSNIDGVTNAIFFKRKGSEEESSNTHPDWNYSFIGPGAGGGPTAVAILGDLCHLVRQPPQKGVSSNLWRKARGHAVQSQDLIRADFYVRFVVKDQSGIVGDICRIFGDKGINISEVWQLNHGEKELEGLARKYHLTEKPTKILPFAITLERTTIGQIKNALDIIRKKDFILVEPIWLPIWSR